MKNYCEYFMENFTKSNFNSYIYRQDTQEVYDPILEYNFARLLYDFLSICYETDRLELNDALDYFFGRLKSKKSISKRMHDFVKFLRQGDVFRSSIVSGHKDMMLHTILNNTEFFEEVIFQFNNKG